MNEKRLFDYLSAHGVEEASKARRRHYEEFRIRRAKSQWRVCQDLRRVLHRYCSVGAAGGSAIAFECGSLDGGGCRRLRRSNGRSGCGCENDGSWVIRRGVRRCRLRRRWSGGVGGWFP